MVCAWPSAPTARSWPPGGCDRIVNVWDSAPGYANAKLEQSIENHADWVFGVAFTPDGKQLLTVQPRQDGQGLGPDDQGIGADLPRSSEHGLRRGRPRPTARLGFSVGEDNQLRTWNATGEGKQVRAASSGGPTFKVVLHPKQPLLVTCSADKTVRIWNADSGATLKTLSGHTDYVYAVAISPDGNLVASGGFGGEVKVWKVADGKNVVSFNAAVGLPLPAAPK